MPGYARKAFLIIPQRWKDNPGIKRALEKRGATARVIHSDTFNGPEAERRARAVVDIVEISYPTKDNVHSYHNRVEEVKDPFDIWFDEKAERLFSCMRVIGMGSARLMLGNGG